MWGTGSWYLWGTMALRRTLASMMIKITAKILANMLDVKPGAIYALMKRHDLQLKQPYMGEIIDLIAKRRKSKGLSHTE